MDDIISQGAERGPGGGRRRLVLAVVVLVVLAVLVIRHLPSGSPARHRPRRESAAGVPPGAPAAVAAGLAGRAVGITGPTAPWPGALMLPSAGEQPSWFWPGSGRRELIAGLPASKVGYVFTRVGGGWAVQPDPIAPTGCGGCAVTAVPAYFLADGARSARLVGSANAVAPAATPAAVWLTSYRPGTDLGTARGDAVEVSASGKRLAAPVRLPAGRSVVQGTARGLLLAPVVQPGGLATSELWDPATGSAAATFTGVIAASASEVAWTGRCGTRCQVHVLDLATGRLSEFGLAPGSTAVNGAFSPDGRYLAVQVSFGSGGDGGALAMEIQLGALTASPGPPLTGGRLATVPGTWVSSDALAGFGWPDGTDLLVAELIFPAKVQIAAWRPDAARPALRLVRPDEAPLSLAVG